MNTHPAHPLDGPPQPSQPHIIPPYGNPIVQVIDPPDESPEESADAIPIISEEFATRRLIHSYNVRAHFLVGLGTQYPIRPLTYRGITDYTTMTRAKWNKHRLNFDSEEGQEIRDLLVSIYRSVLHHQENLIIYGMSSVYALARAAKMWIGPISALLAPFQTQLYLEMDRFSRASIWGDFSNSQRPHPDEEDYSVELALNVVM